MEATVVAASRGRTVAFRIVAGLLGVLVSVLSIPFAIFAPFASGTDVIHRVHNIGGAAGFGLLGILLLVCAWQPERVGAFQAVIVAAVACIIGGLLGGDLLTAGWLIPLVGAMILTPLHPYRGELLTKPKWSLPMAALTTTALIPAVVFALHVGNLQRTGDPQDPHIEMHHWSGMAVMGLILVGVAKVAAMRTTGWRLTAWMAGVAAMVYGGASLAYPNYPGAEGTLWGWLVIAWAALYISAAEWQFQKDEGSA